MDCSLAREVISCRLDGEAHADEDRLDAHLDGCPACRGWSAQAVDVTRRARLQPVPPAEDLADRVLSSLGDAVRPADAWPAERWLLVVVGVAMLVVAVPMLLVGAPDSDVHLLREAGVTELALAVGVLTAAMQPWRAAGMLPVVVALAAGLTVTSVADVVSGRVDVVQESVHTLAPTAALLLWRLRRRGPTWRLSPTPAALRAVGDDRRSA